MLGRGTGAAGLFGGAALIAILFQALACRPMTAVDPPREEPKATAERLAELLPYERGIVEVFQKVSPAVVNVSNLAIASRRTSYFSWDTQEIPRGTGTGFVWDLKGHIVTNYHVIKDADAVSVNFADQTQRRAEVIGYYESKDIAVLKIDLPASRLTPVEPGSSRDLLAGQTVLAIGNPFGLDHTLTTGVVSALGREIRALDNRPIQDVIQTDASINPGNSGGPLLDSRGRLIGMNTAIFSPSGTSTGIGFAIPVDTVRSIVTQIIETGKVTRPGMGVTLFPDSIAARLSVKGAIIREVVSRSSAAKAGLTGTRRNDEGNILLGDILTEVDGKKIEDNDDLYREIDKHKVGDDVEVGYIRDGKKGKTTVKLQSIE